MKILRVVLKMYKVTCECGKNEIIMIPSHYNFSFDVINELFVKFLCSECNQGRFIIRFIFNYDEYNKIFESENYLKGS